MKTSAIAIVIAMGTLLVGPDAQAQDTTPTEYMASGCIPGSFGQACWIAKGKEVQGATQGDLFESVTYVSHPGIAATGTAPLPLLDGSGNPVLVDHDNDPTTASVPAYQEQDPFVGGNARVHGYQSVAIGGGARVGTLVKDANGNQVFLTPQNYDANCPTNGSGQCVDFEGKAIPMTKEVNKGTALGAGAIVEHDGSTAVGADSKTTRKNQIVLGTGKDSITAPGIHNGNQYQAGPKQLVTTDAAGNLGTDGGVIAGAIISNSQAITAQGALLSQHSATLEEHARGIAIAMALPDAWIESNKRFAIAGSVGGFGDETALGAAAILRLDDVWSVNGKLGSDTGFEEFGWQVGARASW